MKTFFTSDLHLGHYNIIKYCNRPFKTLEEMNETIIRKWNSRVKDEDTVYHIGDFCFRSSSNKDNGARTRADEYIKRLNGRIFFIKGNHDRNNSLNTRCFRAVYEHGQKEFDLVHDPKDIDTRYKFHLVGHVHNHWTVCHKEHHVLINVGVDVWDFYPKTIEELTSKKTLEVLR